MLKLLKYLKKIDWLLLVFIVGLIVGQVYLELKMPDYTKELTRIVNLADTNQDMGEVWKNGGLMVLCSFGSMCCAILCTFLVSKVSASLSRNIREVIFNNIMTYSQNEINKFSIPSLITRCTNDVVQIQNFYSMGLQLVLKAPIMAIWAITKITQTHIEWTYAVIVVIALIIIMVFVLFFVVIPRFRKIQKLTDDINDRLRENVSGVRVIRAFNADEYQKEKFEKTNEEIYKNHLVTSQSMGVMMPTMSLLMSGLTLAIYIIAAYLINNITIDVTQGSEAIQAAALARVDVVSNMAVFTSYAMQIIMAFMMLIMIFMVLPRAIVSSKRINEVIKTETTINDGENKEKTNEKGTIEFKNVCFSYNGDQNLTLSNLNFKVNSGETIAIIGATGSGKTTIINLIPRFYDVTKGEVLVDGINVNDYKIDDLRSKISIATQKAMLFKGTIKDNIVYGTKNEIDNNRVEKAVEISHSDFIKELEKGVDSEVSQGGTNFSGGQKQRISIARTLYKDSEILIFDDTFSALDYKTDMLVRKSIKHELKDKTVFIIAQRIGTIKNADKIIVLDNGQIVGIGKHEELLKNCSVYQEIALSQLSKEEL